VVVDDNEKGQNRESAGHIMGAVEKQHDRWEKDEEDNKMQLAAKLGPVGFE
jgi:hypothetical protein